MHIVPGFVVRQIAGETVAIPAGEAARALSGLLALLVYVGFNTLLPEFTHGYITFILPLCACGVVYLASLFATGVLMKLIKKEKRG